MSVFVTVASLRRDYVSFYSVKETLTGEQYSERYPIGATTLTEAQIRDKDYIIRSHSDLYMIGIIQTQIIHRALLNI